MALTIDKTIDLTAYEHNPEPKVVSQLSIIHEASDGELVQYYIDPENETEGDKNTYAVGVYDKDSQSYSYNDYDEVTWNDPDQRICGNRIERLGVKAFPDIGAIAYYKLKHRNISRIVAPVNKKGAKNKAPTLSAVVNTDGTITFTITPPEEPEYACYRIVMQKDYYEEDHITYDLVLTADKPKLSGSYKCFAIGYGKEGQLLSRDSNVLTLELIGKYTSFERPYYMKSEVAAMKSTETELRSQITELETQAAEMENRIKTLEEYIINSSSEQS